MGQPASRITEMHVCPMMTPGVPPIPHVGGPMVVPDAPPVMIAKMPAARLGDSTAHGDTIVLGAPTVLIGG